MDLLTSVILIQRRVKKIIKLKNNMNKEFSSLRDILTTIIRNIAYHNNDFIIKRSYNKSIDLCYYINNIITKYPIIFKISNFYSVSKFKIFHDLAKIKLTLIEITRLVGNINIYQSMSLYLDCNDKNYKDYNKYLKYYDTFFNITKIESYISKNENNISYVLNTYGKTKNKTTSITLASYQIDKPSVNKYHSIIKDLRIKENGVKIYIPYKNKLLVLFGYFVNDNLNTYQNIPVFKEKYIQLKKLFNNLDINEAYRNNYLNTLSISEFCINTVMQTGNNCISKYNDFIKFKEKPISKIVKEFMISDNKRRYQYTKNLLLDTDVKNSGYIANLLIDLLEIDDCREIFNIFHWNIKKRFKLNKINIENFQKMDKEVEIPLDKRIHLMKASNEIKNKALIKLKEINSSKGEGNSKATQYLEGLLKVPFGVYKYEVIRYKLDELKSHIYKNSNLILELINKIQEDYILNDHDLFICDNLSEIINIPENINPHYIFSLIPKLEKWIKTLTDNISLGFYFDTKLSTKLLSKFKSSEIKNLFIDNSISYTSKNKKDLINELLNIKINKKKFISLLKVISLKPKFNIIFSIEEVVKIIETIDIIKEDINNYRKEQCDYFKNIDGILDDAIYGLDNAKIQIKRILGQWVNGKNEGYVFGLEGPPGTGKTTLAKKGIAKCLYDENGNERPFIFIALGGSSNGSTLEGHNYTYVGSTWGRIVDGLMASKCMNPIIYIDELDKISKTEHGKEIIGILTHLTDKSQNSEFSDRYFSGIKFDLSKCLIIFSYNNVNLIDPILLDRIQRINIKSLNKKEKYQVALKYLIPEILTTIGYTENDIHISTDAIEYIIDTYTYEAGVRKLKERLYEIYREINLRSLKEQSIIPFNINIAFISELFIDYPKHDNIKIYDEPKIGTINGLYATSAGIGGITIIETTFFPSTNFFELKLTGQQGDVMKESMSVAKTLALKLIPEKILKDLQNREPKLGIHIHCPAGATKKDGPSAGTAITIALLSLLCNLPIRNNIGITGEINLNGRVLPIGGLYSKAEGARLAGVSEVLCPNKNKDALCKIRKENPEIENDNFQITMIETVYDAIDKLLIFPKKTNKKTFFNKI